MTVRVRWRGEERMRPPPAHAPPPTCMRSSIVPWFTATQCCLEVEMLTLVAAVMEMPPEGATPGSVRHWRMVGCRVILRARQKRKGASGQIGVYYDD